jgi:hypothetical protein
MFFGLQQTEQCINQVIGVIHNYKGNARSFFGIRTPETAI